MPPVTANIRSTPQVTPIQPSPSRKMRSGRTVRFLERLGHKTLTFFRTPMIVLILVFY